MNVFVDGVRMIKIKLFDVTVPKVTRQNEYTKDVISFRLYLLKNGW